jgi:hypothetical protein
MPHAVICTGCAGCGFVELARELRALSQGNVPFHSKL